jgi:hypothetical protein
VSLVARHLEQSGLPTVIIGSARDIVEHCGVPRFVFTDFPLGNPCGPPWQGETQKAIVTLAISLLETAATPRTTITAPFAWPSDDDWRPRYGRVDPAERERLLAIGDARRRRQAEVKRKSQ